jgi:tetratricopeptide (TPR) repeat protein
VIEELPRDSATDPTASRREPARMRPLRARSLLVVALCGVAAGCAQTAVRDSAGARGASPGPGWTAEAEEGSFEERARRVFGDTSLPARSLDEDLLYKFLLAEIANQRGNAQLAAQAYLDLARTTRDPRVARRATEIALYAKLNDIALEAARIWLAAEKDSAAARQTLATLLINARDLRAAKPLLAEILAADKNSVGPALMQLQGVLGRHPDKAAVYELTRDLVKPYGRQPEAQFALAQAAQAAGSHDTALTAARDALRMRPGWEQAALLQAQLLSRESRDKSLDFMKEFLAGYPKAQEVRLSYARGLVSEKRYPQAREQFEALLAANVDNAELAFTVALLSLQMNDLQSADAQLRRVLDLGYKDVDAVRFQLGQVNEELKREDEAARWYREVEGGEQYAAAHARYALMLARRGRLDEARTYLHGLAPRDDAQRVQLIQAEAHMLREVRQYQTSYDVLRNALDERPDQPELLYDIALAAEKLDRLEVVESSLRRLIELRPEHAQAWNALGYTLADRTNRLTEARDYIEKALQLAPDDPFILDSMGWVHYRLGNRREGIDYLRRAFDQRPDPEIAAHLGEALWMDGKREEAQRIWRDSLQSHPDSEELQKVIRKFVR